MTKTRRQFSASFKLEMVKQVKDQGLTIRQVAQEYKLSENCLRTWVQRYESEQLGVTLPGKALTPELRRLQELEAENKRLKEDLEILKKASAFFARALK